MEGKHSCKCWNTLMNRIWDGGMRDTETNTYHKFMINNHHLYSTQFIIWSKIFAVELQLLQNGENGFLTHKNLLSICAKVFDMDNT